LLTAATTGVWAEIRNHASVFFLICQTDMLNAFQICGSLCCVVYMYFHKKKGYFCVVLREEEWRNVGYYCNDGWEDEEGIWVFFLLWNIKELMWVVGRRRRSEFWCDLGLWKSKNKRKKWKMEADDDDGHLFFEALMCQTIFLVIFYFFIS